MMDERLQFVNDALAKYGAHLDENCHICKGEKRLSVRARIVRYRLEFYGAKSGRKLFAGVATERGVCAFVESFYKWEVKK